VSFRRKARDLGLLRGELVQRVGGPLAGTQPGRLQLDTRALGERLYSKVREQLVSGSQLVASVQASALAPQPLAVERCVRASCTRILVRPSRVMASR
jgi:hypothetical protein